MTFQVGRILNLNEPDMWDSSNDDSVVVTGSYRSTGLTDGLVKRDQLLALAQNADEITIPVVLTGEPRVTGYYQPTRAQVLTDIFTRIKGSLYNYRLELARVAAFSNPLCESIISGALLTNVQGATAADVVAYHSVPQAALEYNINWPLGGVALATRSSIDGVMDFVTQSSTPTIPGTAQWAIAPANFYIGAAKFEQGSPLQVVVGRKMTQSDVVNWRLSNGLVRVTPNVTPPLIDVSHYNGSTWSALKTYAVTGFTWPWSGWNSLTVLRNSPEEVIIRLSVANSGALPLSLNNLDIALRRGDRLVRCYTTSSPGAADTMTVKRNTAEAATAITIGAVANGAIRATSNDADGNRYVLLSLQHTVANNLTQGEIDTTVAATTTWDFAIGSEIGGSGAVFPNRAQDLAAQYLAAMSESQRVVAR